MNWVPWVVGLLVLNVGGFMAFDGTKALITGEYVTPKSGAHAGQLGPWSGVVRAAGIEPRSTLMKWIFILYGVAYLAVLGAWLMGAAWGKTALLTLAVAS